MVWERWNSPMIEAVWGVAGGAILTFLGKQWGTNSERHSQAIELLNEVKKLRDEAIEDRKKAEAEHCLEIERRHIAEDKLKKVSDKLTKVQSDLETMSKELTGLKEQVRYHNELQDQYDEAIVEIDNLTSELEEAQKKLIESELRNEKLEEELEKYKDLWIDHCKRKIESDDNDDGMDPSGIPVG